jgi:hypothetical protein
VNLNALFKDRISVRGWMIEASRYAVFRYLRDSNWTDVKKLMCNAHENFERQTDTALDRLVRERLGEKEALLVSTTIFQSQDN